MPYFYTDELTTSDAAFFARGADVAEMCAAACDAVAQLMVTNLDDIQETEERQMDLAGDTVEVLVRKCLEEIVFYKDAEGFILRLQPPSVWTTPDDEWRLHGRARGEAIDPDRHQTGVDVKAVTYHNFSVRKHEHGWEASVVVDV